jgi:hypothetical protein
MRLQASILGVASGQESFVPSNDLNEYRALSAIGRSFVRKSNESSESLTLNCAIASRGEWGSGSL